MSNALRKSYTYGPTMLEVLVLAAIRKSGNIDVDVVSVQSAIERHAGLDSSHTSIYKVLGRLHGLDLLSMRRITVPSRGGQKRLLYSMTNEGHIRLATWLDQIVEMI